MNSILSNRNIGRKPDKNLSLKTLSKFDRRLSKRKNSFGVDLAIDEIVSTLAQLCDKIIFCVDSASARKKFLSFGLTRL